MRRNQPSLHASRMARSCPRRPDRACCRAGAEMARGLHPEPLTEPYVTFSHHIARATLVEPPPSVRSSGFSGLPLAYCPDAGVRSSLIPDAEGEQGDVRLAQLGFCAAAAR